MIVFALISFAVSPTAQDGAVPYTAEVYAAPVVRPFEPPSDFGRVTGEGDGGSSDVRRRPIAAPVAVESYRRSYEYSASSAEAIYDRGVEQAQANMDSRMGPLDGRWHVRDAEGRVLMSLVLSDRGANRPLEGAWRRHDATAAMGPASAVERGDQAVVLDLSEGRLALQAATEGWTGTLTEGGRSRAVILSR